MDGISISYYSIVSAVLYFNFGLIVIVIMRHNLLFFMKHSTWSLFLLFVVSVIRVLLPLDMEKAIVVNSDKIYPFLLDILYAKILANTITLGSILLVCWGLGSIVFFVADIIQYIAELHAIRNFVIIEDKQVKQISRQKFSKKAKIFVTPNVSVPKVTGIYKAYIYLPPIDVSDSELCLILKHEIQHIREYSS